MICGRHVCRWIVGLQFEETGHRLCWNHEGVTCQLIDGRGDMWVLGSRDQWSSLMMQSVVFSK